MANEGAKLKRVINRLKKDAAYREGKRALNKYIGVVRESEMNESEVFVSTSVALDKLNSLKETNTVGGLVEVVKTMKLPCEPDIVFAPRRRNAALLVGEALNRQMRRLKLPIERLLHIGKAKLILMAQDQNKPIQDKIFDEEFSKRDGKRPSQRSERDLEIWLKGYRDKTLGPKKRAPSEKTKLSKDAALACVKSLNSVIGDVDALKLRIEQCEAVDEELLLDIGHAMAAVNVTAHHASHEFNLWLEEFLPTVQS